MECIAVTSDRGIDNGRIGYKWNIILVVYYLALSSLLINVYRNNMDPDGTSYISLAQKYLNGDFGNVVSGHWSPMISWLIVPFMFLGLDPIIAYKITSIFIGIISLVGINKLMVEIEITRNTRRLYLVALSPVVAWYAENGMGADMLCACVLLFYIHSILRDEYQHKKYAGIAVGLLGALSYLAKSYNFYFFLLHFTCINACYWKQATSSSQKRTIAFNFISAIVVFALISGVWAGLISAKYHTLTVGTAGAYNFSHIRPGHSTDTHPMLTDGFMPPPNPTAISVWEDPYYINIVPWSPFKSVPDFIYYLKYIAGNIYKCLRGLAFNYILDLTVISFVAIHLFSKKTLHKKVPYILLTLLLYPLGYFALYYDGQRYILIVPILLYILNAYLVNLFLLTYEKNRILKSSISAILCASLIALTLVRIKNDYRYDLNEMNDIYRVSTSIAKYYDMQHVNIASQNGDWYRTLGLSYFLNARYYGKARDDVTDEQLLRELINYRINYYLVFGNLKNHIDILIPEQKFESLAGDMTVYRVGQQH